VEERENDEEDKKKKMITKSATICAVYVCMLLTAGMALAAIDINPPPWWQETNTTWQVWEFSSSDAGPIEPDWDGYLLGTHLTITPASDWLAQDLPCEYIPEIGLGAGFGVWQLSGGSINAFVENFQQPNPQKRIWIQITWRPQESGDCPVIYLQDSLGGQLGPVTNPLSVIQIGSDWIHSTYEIVLNYNPPDEIIRIAGSINVDDLVIDTWCSSIPEPATITLLAIGSLILSRRSGLTGRKNSVRIKRI
jgi:hypothetical protein